MTKNDAVAIRFDTGAEVPIGEAFAYADTYEGRYGYAAPRAVIWSDGSWSFAKGWWSNPGGRLAVIGAGAYGDMRVLERVLQ